MTGAAELGAALAGLAGPGLVTGCRRIAPGDAEALWPEEAATLRRAVPGVRAQSGAARIVARGLMARLGQAPAAIPRATGAPPRWPAGLVGSLAHDPDYAVAVLGRAERWRGLGVDLEPALPLPEGVLEEIATPYEIARLDPGGIGGRLVFAVKEALYKAVNPIDGCDLGFHDVEVDLAAGLCRTATGWRLPVACVAAPRICALVAVARD